MTPASLAAQVAPCGRRTSTHRTDGRLGRLRDAVSTTGGELQYLSQRFELRRLSVTGLDTLAGFAARARLAAAAPPAGADPMPAGGGAEPGGLRVRRR